MEIELEKSLLISALVLLLPAVLIITAIPSATSSHQQFFKSFSICNITNFSTYPPPLGVFGISTQYLPAMEIYVVKAAPFVPRSSFTTCTNKI